MSGGEGVELSHKPESRRGLFIQAGSFFQAAKEARDRCVAAFKADQEHAAPLDAVVAVILSTVACEAFINELPDIFSVMSAATISTTEFPQVAACVDALREIDRGSLTLKYLIASQTLSGKMFHRGKNPFQDFRTLIDLRNALVHFRPMETFDPSDPNIHTHPKIVKALQSRGLARRDRGWASDSSLNALLTEKIAIWACDTAQNITTEVFEMIPDRHVVRMTFSFLQKRQAERSEMAKPEPGVTNTR